MHPAGSAGPYHESMGGGRDETGRRSGRAAQARGYWAYLALPRFRMRSLCPLLLAALLSFSIGVEDLRANWTDCSDPETAYPVDCCGQCPDCPHQHGETGDLRPGYRCTTRTNFTGSCPGEPSCQMPDDEVKQVVTCVPQFECGYTSPGTIHRRGADGTPWSEHNPGGPGLIINEWDMGRQSHRHCRFYGAQYGPLVKMCDRVCPGPSDTPYLVSKTVEQDGPWTCQMSSQNQPIYSAEGFPLIWESYLHCRQVGLISEGQRAFQPGEQTTAKRPWEVCVGNQPMRYVQTERTDTLGRLACYWTLTPKWYDWRGQPYACDSAQGECCRVSLADGAHCGSCAGDPPPPTPTPSSPFTFCDSGYQCWSGGVWQCCDSCPAGTVYCGSRCCPEGATCDRDNPNNPCQIAPRSTPTPSPSPTQTATPTPTPTSTVPPSIPPIIRPGPPMIPTPTPTNEVESPRGRMIFLVE